MVFRSRPYRQSAFISADPFSVARAEIQQNVILVWPYLKRLANCYRCEIYDDHIYFHAGGRLTLPLTPLMPANIAELHVEFDVNKTPSSTALQYQVLRGDGLIRFAGTLAIGNRQEVLKIPLYIVEHAYLTLSSQSEAVAYFRIFWLVRVFNGIMHMVLPAPTVYQPNILQPFFHRMPPKRYFIGIFWRSADGNPATLTYTENDIAVATFSTTSTSAVWNWVGRMWTKDINIGYSASPNAVVHAVDAVIHFYEPLGSMCKTTSVQSSYSTTSITYVQNTPLNLSATTARVRKIVVAASPNAKWYVTIDGNKVLDSTWGINSLDFDTPSDAARVDIWLASADGANATATIAIIYDHCPGLPP